MITEIEKIVSSLDTDAMLEKAIGEAQIGLAEGGVPIGGAMYNLEGELVSSGHNRRVQDGDPSIHGETDAFRKAGRQKTYKDKIMITTLAPCWYCCGLIKQFKIPAVIMGEQVNFQGGVSWLRENGIYVLDMNSKECIMMLKNFINEYPNIWNEDIGED